jgi:hypothetical protein
MKLLNINNYRLALRRASAQKCTPVTHLHNNEPAKDKAVLPVTLGSLQKAAAVVGRRVNIELV